MSQDICIDPRLRPIESPLVCEAPTDTTTQTPLVADATPRPLGIATSTRTAFTSAPTFRDSQAFRAAILRDAFSTSRRGGEERWENPLAYSLWALLPVACSSHPSLLEDGSDSSDGGSDGGETIPPASLDFSGFETHDNTPCGSSGIVTDLDESVGVCANYGTNQHHLFSWDPTRAGVAASIIPLTWAPDQVLQGNGDEIFITTHQNPGLAVVHPAEGSESHHPFPESIPSSGVSSSGRAITSIHPSYPKGLVELADQVFIASSNYDEVHEDYLPGTVLAFQKSSGNFGVLSTSGFNPTSVGVANGRLLVVSSGAVDRNGNATTEGYLDIFDPLTHELIRSIPLGRRGAGVSGEIALSPDEETAYLPTADNSGRLLAVNLRNGVLREISLRAAGISGSRIFFPSLQVSADGRFGAVANFNDGKVYSVDLTEGTTTSTPLLIDTATDDGEGLGDGLQISGEYFLGMGSRILRLQRQP